MRQVVELAGVAVALEAPPGPWAEAVAGLLRGLPTVDGPAAAAVRVVGSGAPPPGGEPDERHDDLLAWHRGDDLAYEHASGVGARAGDAGAVIGGEPSAWFGGPAGDPGAAVRRLLPLVLARLLLARGRYLLHSGAAARDGAALLLMGPPGAGKSTLGLAAARSGWTLLSDGLAVLRETAGGLLVTGVPKPPAIPADVLPADALGRLVPGDPRGRWELEPDLLGGGWFPLAGVVLPGHSASRGGRLLPAKPSRLLPLAVGSFPLATNPPALRRYFRHAGAIARLPAWDLLHSPDPKDRLEVAAGLLSRAAAAAKAP